jgi:hypothetical protein
VRPGREDVAVEEVVLAAADERPALPRGELGERVVRRVDRRRHDDLVEAMSA